MRVEALFNTGAALTVIRKSVVEKISPIWPPILEKVTLADGKTELPIIGLALFWTFINVCRISDIAHVVERLVEEFIIGVETMERYGIELKPETGEVIVKKCRVTRELL